MITNEKRSFVRESITEIKRLIVYGLIACLGLGYLIGSNSQAEPNLDQNVGSQTVSINKATYIMSVLAAAPAIGNFTDVCLKNVSTTKNVAINSLTIFGGTAVIAAGTYMAVVHASLGTGCGTFLNTDAFNKKLRLVYEPSSLSSATTNDVTSIVGNTGITIPFFASSVSVPITDPIIIPPGFVLGLTPNIANVGSFIVIIEWRDL